MNAALNWTTFDVKRYEVNLKWINCFAACMQVQCWAVHG